MKPFSQELYDQDDNAKFKVLSYLQGRDINAIVNPDQYGVDLIETDGPRTWEVEVKHNWAGGRFPFQTVHISARKLKFAIPHSWFSICNHSLESVIFIKGEVAAASPIVSKSTIYTQDEQFIAVPLREAWVGAL